MEATQEDNGVVELDLRTELGNEILARSEGDILNQNNLSALSLAMGEYRIKTEDELLAEKLARQTFGTDINFAWDKHLSSFTNLTFLVRQHVNDTAAIMEGRYQELDQRVQKYENMLYDITMDSANFTMDRTDIEFSGWTILAQAAAWDNEILKKLSNFKADIDQSIKDSLDNGLEDVINNIPDLEEWINDAIDALGNSPIISDLYDLLNQADGKVDGVKDDFFQSLGALRTEALGEVITLRNNIEKELRDYTDNLALEVDARHVALDTLTTALQTEIDERIEAMESIASGMQGDIAERLAKIDELEDGLTTERNERTEAHDKLIQEINTYKASTDNSLAVLQTDVKAHTTELEAITEEVKLLHANVGEFESTILEKYATKADLNSTEASISTLMESKLKDSSDALSQKIDETKTSVIKDIDGKITAQTKVTDGLKSTIDGNQAAIVNNYLTKVDTNKAITEAVNTAKTTLNSSIANEAGRIDKVTTNVTKVGNDLVALSEDVKSLNALVDENQATLTENYYTKVKADEAISGKVTQYTSKLSMQSKKATLVFTTETLPTLVTNAPNTPVAVSIDATAKAGSIITFGTGTGASEAIYTLAPEEAILINPDKLYVVRYRFKRISGDGGVYIGLSCLNESRTKNITTSNVYLSLTSFASSHYVLNNSRSALGEWVTGEYYFKGRVESGAATGGGTKANPRKLAAHAVYARPMFWSSYQTQDTVTVCDYVELECLDIDTDEYATAKALTDTKAEVIADADGKIKAVSSDLVALSGTVGSNQAKLVNNYSTTVDMNKAISNATTSLTARMDGIRKSSQNLINRWVLSNGYLSTADGSVAGANTTLQTDRYDDSYYPCSAGDVFTCTKVDATTTPTGSSARIAWYDTNKVFLRTVTIVTSAASAGASTTLTAPANAAYFRYGTTNPRDRVKLERGSTFSGWTAEDESEWAEPNASKQGALLSDAIDTLKVDVSKNAEGITANANKTTLLEIKGTGDNVTSLLKDPQFMFPDLWGGTLKNSFKMIAANSDSYVKSAMSYPGTTSALTGTSTANNYFGDLYPEYITVTPGRTYSVSGDIRNHVTSAKGIVQVYANQVTSDGTAITNIKLFELDLSKATTYNTFNNKFIAVDNAARVMIRLRLQYDSSGDFNVSFLAFPNLRVEVEPVSLSKAMTVLDTKYEDIAGVQKSQSTLVTSLESKLNNQKIGGTNILRGTQSGGFIKYGTANVSNVTETVGVAFKTSVYRLDRLVASSGMGITTSTANKTGTLKNGKEYTISFYARGTKVPNYVYTMGSSSTGANTGRSVTTKGTFSETDFVLFTGTFTANFDAIGKVGILIGTINGAVGEWLEVAEVMIQEGNTPTDWQDSYLDIPDLSEYATSTYVAGVKTDVTKDINDKIKVVTDSTTVLQGKLDENTSAISIQAKITDGLKAQYLVKMETNGVLAGFGLLQSTNVLGQVVSAFGVNADNFYIGAPASGKKPFIVTTKSTTVNGVTYPAGTWIDVAFIANATIGTAHIANASITTALIKDAAITNAKINDLNASKINAGTINAARIGASTITADKLAASVFNSTASDGSRTTIAGGTITGYYKSGKLSFYIGP